MIKFLSSTSYVFLYFTLILDDDKSIADQEENVYY